MRKQVATMKEVAAVIAEIKDDNFLHAEIFKDPALVENKIHVFISLKEEPEAAKEPKEPKEPKAPKPEAPKQPKESKEPKAPKQPKAGNTKKK